MKSDLRQGRLQWFRGLRDQNILSRKVYSKAEAKAKVVAVSRRLSVLPDFSKKSKAKKAMRLVHQELLRELSEPPLYFYGHKTSNAFRFFSNFFLTDIVVLKDELLSTCRLVLPHVDLEELDTAEKAWSFPSSEHLFMFLKALCMQDGASAVAIYNAATPAAAKKLGRQVAPYDDALWEACGPACMLQAVLAKARSCPPMRTALLATGDRVIAEASARDCKWGVGLSLSKAETGACWRGINLLGEALVRAREILGAVNYNGFTESN